MGLLSGFNAPVHYEQIRSMYRQSPFLLMGVPMVMTVVGIFFWPGPNQNLVVIWLVVNLFLTLGRLLLVRSFERQNPSGKALLKWGVAFALTATLSGIVWGSIAVLFMQPSSIESVLLVTLVRGCSKLCVR